MCEHVDDDIDLPMADLSDILKSDIPREELIKDSNVIEALEEAVMSWKRHIAKVIDSYLTKVTQLTDGVRTINVQCRFGLLESSGKRTPSRI